MGENINGRISFFFAQMSIYSSEKQGQEGGADSTIRAYVDGGIRFSTGNWFFEISSGHGSFRTGELLICPQLQAQNIFSGKLASLPPSVFFVPNGWRTHTHIAIDSNLEAALGGISIFGQEGAALVSARCEDGREAQVRMDKRCALSLPDGAAATVDGAAADGMRRVILCPDANAGGEAGASMLTMRDGDGEYTLLCGARKRGSVVEIQCRMEEGAGIASQGHPLVAKPDEFDSVFTAHYYVSDDGWAKLELFDIFGLRRKTVIDERTMRGAHEIRVDMESLPPGPYTMKFSVDGRKAGQAQVVKRFAIGQGGNLWK